MYVVKRGVGEFTYGSVGVWMHMDTPVSSVPVDVECRQTRRGVGEGTG